MTATTSRQLAGDGQSHQARPAPQGRHAGQRRGGRHARPEPPTTSAVPNVPLCALGGAAEDAEADPLRASARRPWQASVGVNTDSQNT